MELKRFRWGKKKLHEILRHFFNGINLILIYFSFYFILFSLKLLYGRFRSFYLFLLSN
jgi:hypothetical protein